MFLLANYIMALPYLKIILAVSILPGASRKRPSLVHQSSSCDTPGPWSPGSYRPHTPTLNTPTYHVPKKKRLMSSTPSFDIDNIVIPYSMAATTRYVCVCVCVSTYMYECIFMYFVCKVVLVCAYGLIV